MKSFWNGKRVFVTGHTGFKGSWFCKILELLGAEVTGYALKPQTEIALFDICKPQLNSVIGDIRDYDRLLTAIKNAKPEIVFHMAAQPLVLASYQNPQYTYDVNVMGTVHLLECIRQIDGIKSFVNITTDKVYLNRERQKGYCEEEQLNGYDPYSNSKSCSELVTSSYNLSFLNKKGVAVSCVRSGNVIGGGDFSENRLIPDCARAASVGETIKIRNPTSVRPYQHVLDTLFAYLLVAQRQYEEFSLSGAYNIGPEENDCATSSELATLFCNAWGNEASWECISVENPHEAGLLKLDCTKIKRMLGWLPKWNIERTIKETALWYQVYFQDGDVSEVMHRQINEFMNDKF